MENYLRRKEGILGFIKSESYTPMRGKEIALLLQIPREGTDELFKILNDLEAEGEIVISKKGKIMLPKQLGIVTGEFVGNKKGFGFVVTDDDEEDIFIAPHLVGQALNKDKVMCRIIDEGVRRREGEIVRVISRGMNVIVGTFEKMNGFGFVICDEKKIPYDIFVEEGNSLGAVTGHKVIVEITKGATEGRSPEGIITHILGHIDDPGVDILSIIMQYELPLEFSDEVENEIENIALSVSDEEKANRRDYRSWQMITIDGEDAKDLDDAVAISRLENGNYKLGVFIADVSHYVREGSALDKEAYKRGTSVYLVDRVIPMLPHKLSNGICSLNAGEDRLSLCCVMEINQRGEVVNYEIEKALIKVDRRMSYTVVNDLLTNENSEYLNEFGYLLPMLKEMETLRNILLQKRVKRGAVDFGFSEAKILLDEGGRPIDIVARQRNVATSIIEEFMLAANECVAQNYFWLETPFVYRSHEAPSPDKVNDLKQILFKLGYSFKGSATHSKTFQSVLEGAKGSPEEKLINRVVLRSMQQARYTAENQGHFGLAAQYYCHFTSPIRRYPDLQIHRIISLCLENKADSKEMKRISKKMNDVAYHCSVRERVAEDAERETDKVKMVEYMADKIGMEYEGVISSVTSWGIYVELDNLIEGMVSAKALDDDYYEYDEKNLCYLGTRMHKCYSIGDKVKIKVVRANLEDRTIDFDFV